MFEKKYLILNLNKKYLINQLHFHAQINDELLDHYLSNGWYRMGQMVFTTNNIEVENVMTEVYWLRYPLANISLQKKQQQIITANKKFNICIKPFLITTEILNLYETYFNSINFEASPSLESYLGFDALGFPIVNNVFDSYGVEIRDQEKLIAYGVFDNGKNSIAGIINFYDPAYKKYSLGKFLMLITLQYAINKSKQYYYPGYIAKGWTKFDYKLFISKSQAEIWNEEQETWEAYKKFAATI